MLKIKNAPESLLHEDPCKTPAELAESLGVDHTTVSKRLKASGMIQKQCQRVTYQLKPRDVERRLFACEQLLHRQKRKGYLPRIVTGDEKWIHYDNPKRRESWGLVQPRINIVGKAKCPWFQASVQHLVGSAGRNLL
ncbi:Mariner Mos1 transposase [Araneus ventricosus]|uniref:Mariner Mos1 transposase n=1 Tax=Araneus ventricosus TaxID=182803 RepID=A0A4Y2U9P8_ARAVE|nr:Mariner Mos1 transposase [Araneus ventricosus]